MTDRPLTSEEVAALVGGNLLDEAAARMDARVAKLYPSNEGHNIRVDDESLLRASYRQVLAPPVFFRNHAEEIDAIIKQIHPGLRRTV